MRKIIGLCLVIYCCLSNSAWAQTTEISGRVIDANGLPIANASVREKDTKNGTTANTNGIFKIKVKEGALLIISAIGFETLELAAKNQMTASMVIDVKGMNEVVVTGTGVATSKRKLGISVETIGADKLPPSQSINQALIGKVAGAQISSNDGTPGARSNILLRGINSLRGGTSPMILIDGIEVRATDLSALDPNIIDRIEVVEGAASSTIYGAQGANGVIQIFSKKGKPGQMNIDFSTSYGRSNFLNEGNLHKAMTHGFKTDANNNVIDKNGVIIGIRPDGTYTAGTNSAGVVQDAIVWDVINDKTIDGSKVYNQNLKVYDHISQIFQEAQQYNANLSIRGGTEKTDYAVSLSHARQESTLQKNGTLKRTSFSSNFGAEIFKGFKIRSGTQLIFSRDNFNPYFTAGPGQIFSMLNTSPFYDFEWKDAKGNYAYVLPAGTVSVNGRNPNYYFQYAFGTNSVIDVIQNLQASYRVNRFLDLDFKYGINYQKQDVNQVFKNQTLNINSSSNSAFIGGFSSAKGGVTNSSGTVTFTNALSTANFHLDFEKDLHLKLPIASTTLIGYDYRKNVGKTYNTSGDGLQLYPIYNMTQTDTRTITTDNVTTFVTFGTFLSQSFDYANLFGIKGGFRSDYSSAFGQGSKPQTFYNGNAYFRISQLNFWNNMKQRIPEFKIRASYGQAGIQPGAFNRYVTLNTAQVGSGLAFASPSTQSNPDLSVEISKEKEIGTDLTFNIGKGSWLSNLTLAATIWKRTSEDVIYAVDLPASTGSGSILTNAFSLSSRGYTFAFNMSVLKSKEVNWDFTTNFNHQTSKIDAVTGGADIIVTSSAGYGNYVLRAGEKIGQLYGLRAFTSFDQTRQNGTPYIPKADYGKYQLANGYLVDTATKGIMFTNENYAFGDPNPKFNMAFINNFSYKGFSLSVQVDWVYGSHLYNQTKEWMYRDGIHGDYAEKISINGRSAAWASYYFSAYADQWGAPNGARNFVKNYFYEDASFVRLRNLSLSYDVLKIANFRAVKKLQFVISGRNLWTATKYTGMDPETSSGASNSGFDRGVDYVTMPNSRSIQVGINVGF
jgi:TonB-linked SusC/RagA family outer membrane protein